jgi:hypothetical protein
VIKSLITLASVANGLDYSSEGLTLEKLGLAHIAAEKLPAILQNGFASS